MSDCSLPYQVAHCSSWDEDYSPEQLVKSNFGNELFSEKCKGWQTSKYPEYPQDLIFHLLSGPARIQKIEILSHHFKIATKMDVYIGSVKEDSIPDTDEELMIEFTRLGFVRFDNNAGAHFRARELKSIKTNMDGEYVRLVIRNCHNNNLNVFNQVGIHALNIHGQTIEDRIPYESKSPPLYRLDQDSSRPPSVNSQRSLSPYSPNPVEVELEQWAHLLSIAEEDAVQSESYQAAKVYNYLSTKMLRFKKIVAELEGGKRYAIETKDYDEAEKIKYDIEDIRHNVELLLNKHELCITPEGELATSKPNKTQKRLSGALEIPKDDEDELEMGPRPEDWAVLDQPRKQPTPPLEEEEEEFVMLARNAVDPESIPEPILDEEREPFRLAIHVFGEDTVACLLSIKSKCRGRGLGQMETKMDEVYQLARNDALGDLCNLFEQDSFETQQAVEDFVIASLMLIQETVMDSREAIVTLVISIWHQLLDFCEEVVVDTELTIDWVERAFGGLLKRTSDSHQRIRQDATALILVLVQAYSEPPNTLVSLYVGKPERLMHNHKEAKFRIQLVETTVRKLGVKGNKKKNGFVSLEDTMAFVVAYLKHSHEDVREAAVKLVITISDQVGFSRISSYIDSSLKVSLADTVKKFASNNKTIKSDTKKTISEINAMAAPSQKLKLKKTEAKSTTAKKTTNTRTPRSKPKEELVLKEEDNLCIFCEQVNPDFNEETLIKHYYNACPVLTTCPTCKVITEIATLNEHMLKDCEKSHLIKECTRCHQAIPVEQWLQHSLKQTCPNLSDRNRVVCPLCITNIEPPNESGWKSHLQTGEGCPKLKKNRLASKAIKKRTIKK
ncbi:hypothetical protein BY458DRAFT_527171 [Sporodiniella umbellata]|nr:hypothetical protein BY458DRAFT_527171 [Sporodiniella umbellata]